MPAISKDKVAQLASCAGPRANLLWEEVKEPMFQTPPFGLGRPGELTQSAYYPGLGERCFPEDTTFISNIMTNLSILPLLL